jgi:hypothetical protein
MKKRDEKLVDSRLEKMGIEPCIYHFEKDTGPFTAISIAEDRLTWAGARRVLNHALRHMERVPSLTPATQLINRLREHDDVFGLAVCDRRDQLNRQRGRTIAKGRLWKHLKQGGK